MVRTVIIVAFIVSVLGAPAPLLHYSNTTGFAMFVDLGFLLPRLLESVVAGGAMFAMTLIIGLIGIGVGHAIRWMTA